jgi:hypothetical protein
MSSVAVEPLRKKFCRLRLVRKTPHVDTHFAHVTSSQRHSGVMATPCFAWTAGTYASFNERFWCRWCEHVDAQGRLANIHLRRLAWTPTFVGVTLN